jgi:hypothetical protein
VVDNVKKRKINGMKKLVGRNGPHYQFQGHLPVILQKGKQMSKVGAVARDFFDCGLDKRGISQ